MAALRIYLADLTHIGNGVATEAFPLNAGLIASYAKKVYGNEVDIRLFKLPDDLKAAIQECPPHILGCSNYTWNSNLSYYFCSWVKSLDRQILTVWGGSNYPFDPPGQRKLLERRPDVDIHVYYEGEHAFTNIIARVLSVSRPSEVFDSPIPGCQFIDRRTGQFVNGGVLPRIRDLDTIPSPYVTGLLDKFFDARLTLLVETARGCPFTCNYCNASHSYFTKVNQFSDDYVHEELTYIAQRASKVGIGHVIVADNNFGMIRRDANTARLLAELRRKYGWPMTIDLFTGKNVMDRVIEVTRVLGEATSITMSVQSMDDGVLERIGRKNIKLDHYRKIAEHLNAEGRPQYAEMIMPLPGETFQSHVRGLNELLDSGVRRVVSHTLQMNHGTRYRDDENYREAHGYVTKYRSVILDFSRIDGAHIFDTEEVAVATNTFSLSEYVEARRYLLVIDVCYNSGVFDPLKRYLASLHIKNSEWIQALFERLDGFPPPVKDVLDSFARETVSELWDSEAELIKFYSQPEQYEKLVRYEAGGNVLYKHKFWMLMQAGVPWVEAVFRCTEEIALQDRPPEARERIRQEFDTLKRYVLCTGADCFTPSSLGKVFEETFAYDIPAWLRAGSSALLADFAVGRPLRLRFSFTPETEAILQDAFERYGTDLAGLVKLAQRTGSVFIRKVAYQERADASGRANPS